MSNLVYLAQEPSYDLGNLLAQLRNRTQLTQFRLAELVGVSEKTVRNWETGSNYPRASHLKKLIALYIQQGIFTPQQERREAEELWLKAKLNAAFDATWFEGLLQTQASPTSPEVPANLAMSQATTYLPVPLTGLIGREQEVAQVCAMLCRAEVRLVTLTGPGGTGKTRLGLAVAAQLQTYFPQGVYFITLAELNKPDLVASTIAHKLGLKQTSATMLVENLKAYLRSRCLLLVLDNYEHLLSAAPLITELLEVAPFLKVLVTSRACLRLYGEYEMGVSPLALPPLPQSDLKRNWTHYPALALAVERIQATQADFELSEQNLAKLAQLCIQLEGLPLAIELAVARSRFLSLDALLSQLQHRLSVLVTQTAGLPARQQNLRATLEWSYKLLNQAEQRLFRRLAVFKGGWTTEAAERVGNFDGHAGLEISAGLEQLSNQSLLQIERASGQIRFRMLETVREYAMERLEQKGELQAVQEAHFNYYLALAEQAAPQLESAARLEWGKRLAAEHNNLRVALNWAILAQKTERALRLAGALGGFWWWGGHLKEGRDWLAAALALPGKESEAERALALYRAANLALVQSEYQLAWQLGQASLALYQQSQDTKGVALLLHHLGRTALEQSSSQYEISQALLEESLALYQSWGDSLNQGLVLINLGRLALFKANYSQAQTLLEESLAQCRASQNKWGQAVAGATLGSVALLSGDYTRAATLAEESLNLYRELDEQTFIPAALLDLGLAVGLQGNYARSEVLLVESLQLCYQQGNQRLIADSLTCLAGLAVVQGQPVHAVQLYGAAEVLREQLGTPIPQAFQALYNYFVAMARNQLDNSQIDFNKIWAEGRELELELVVRKVRGDKTF